MTRLAKFLDNLYCLLPGRDLALDSAASRLFWALADTPLGIATRDGMDDASILSAFGNLLADRAKITCRRPGARRRQVFDRRLLRYMRVDDGAKVIRNDGGIHVIEFVDLRVSRKEFERAKKALLNLPVAFP